MKEKNKLTSYKKIINGDFYSINTKKAKGHKGQLRNIKKNGTAKAVMITHAPYTRNRKNWHLNENPQGDISEAYLVTVPEHVIIKKHVGKHHPNMQAINPIDKSKIRKIIKKKKGWSKLNSLLSQLYNYYMQ